MRLTRTRFAAATLVLLAALASATPAGAAPADKPGWNEDPKAGSQPA